MSNKTLSELEGVTLGIVHKQQGCTAYAVRRELKQSPSTYWRASAGAIYPLLERLEKAGLVESKEDSGDGRGRRFLSLTSDGKRALRSWIVEGLDPEVVAAVFDPIRSRAFFLDVLSRPRREKFVADSIGVLERYLETTRAHLAVREDDRDSTEYLANLGAVYEAEARLRWMKAVLEQIEARSPTWARTGALVRRR